MFKKNLKFLEMTQISLHNIIHMTIKFKSTYLISIEFNVIQPNFFSNFSTIYIVIFFITDTMIVIPFVIIIIPIPIFCFNL